MISETAHASKPARETREPEHPQADLSRDANVISCYCHLMLTNLTLSIHTNIITVI